MAGLNIASTILRNRGAALIEAGTGAVWRFEALAEASARLAQVLHARGLGPGDVLAMLLPQGAPALITLLAGLRGGMTVLPLFPAFGPEALGQRLGDSGARLVVSDGAGAARLPPVEGLALLVWEEAARAMERVRATFPDVPTGAEDAAFLLYTSGTTGQPKGVILPQRMILGHLPGFQAAHPGFPSPGDLVWTPADWSWLGGLGNTLLPALWHGVPVLADAERFDPDRARALAERFAVRNAFLPPTALRRLRAAGGGLTGLRTASSAGEALGAALFDWTAGALGVPVRELYGQTECNLIIGQDAPEPRPEFIGREIRGHAVAVLDDEGRPVPDGEEGEIAVRRPDPSMFLGYRNRPEAMAEKFRGAWMMTGDRAVRDAEGWFSFRGRADDLINVAGFRVGPGEIEACLMGHPAVAMAAAVAMPDPLRGEVVRAHVVLKEGQRAGAEALRAFVRARLAPHMTPAEVVFEPSLPLTETGKVRRAALRAQRSGGRPRS